MIIPSNTKSECYSYQWDDKPKLFSWSLEKEYYHIECRMTGWHRRLSETEQEQTRNLYRRFTDLFLKYIQTQQLTEGERQELAEGIQHKSSRVWEKNSGYIELLAFYEPFFKELIRQLCGHKASYLRERGLLMVNGVFTREEKQEILADALGDKSAAVRARAADVILQHRLKELLPALEARKQMETNSKVLSGIKFTRFYMDKPPGNSITFTPEDRAAFAAFE